MVKKVKCIRKYHEWRPGVKTTGSFHGFGHGVMEMRICRKCSEVEMVSFEGKNGKITITDNVPSDVPGPSVS